MTTFRNLFVSACCVVLTGAPIAIAQQVADEEVEADAVWFRTALKKQRDNIQRHSRAEMAASQSLLTAIRRGRISADAQPFENPLDAKGQW